MLYKMDKSPEQPNINIAYEYHPYSVILHKKVSTNRQAMIAEQSSWLFCFFIKKKLLYKDTYPERTLYRHIGKS